LCLLAIIIRVIALYRVKLIYVCKTKRRVVARPKTIRGMGQLTRLKWFQHRPLPPLILFFYGKKIAD